MDLILPVFMTSIVLHTYNPEPQFHDNIEQDTQRQKTG